jgi:HSP20 family protein
MREMDQLRREMNRLFSEWPARVRWGVAPGYPALNVWTKEDNAIVTAELAGVELEDIEIGIEEDALTLRGDRNPDDVDESATFHRRERLYGSFERSVRLPFRADPEKAEATLANGVLTIKLQRAEVDRPKSITVKAG